jgi:hypothetical protein
MTTTINTVAVTNSTVDSTPIGSTTVSTAKFTTPSSGDNSTNAATTAWCLLGFVISLATNGYIKFPTWLSGFTIQWGTAFSLNNNTPTTVNFPTPFNTQCFAVVANDNSSFASSGNPRTMGCTVASASQCTILANGAGASAFFIAVGY